MQRVVFAVVVAVMMFGLLPGTTCRAEEGSASPLVAVGNLDGQGEGESGVSPDTRERLEDEAASIKRRCTMPEGRWTQEAFFCLRYWVMNSPQRPSPVLPTVCEACIAASQDAGFDYWPTLERCRRACAVP